MRLTNIPKKNIWSYILYIFPIICIFSPIKSFLFKYVLKNCKGCVIEPGLRFYYGDNVHAENVALSNTLLMDYDEINIGNGSAFSKDCIVITGSHDIKNRNIIITKPVNVGRNVWIATRSIILPGVTIGDNCVVGAGSVVTRSVPPHCLVAGNPARIVKRI